VLGAGCGKYTEAGGRDGVAAAAAAFPPKGWNFVSDLCRGVYKNAVSVGVVA